MTDKSQATNAEIVWSDFIITPFLAGDSLNDIVTAWSQAFREPPNGPRFPQELERQLHQHFAFPQFHGFVARELVDQQVLGIIYGYSNQPGQWWYDRVAHALGKKRTEEYLRHSFCLTELGVVAATRRRGVADALVTTLLTHQPYPLALLSTRSDNNAGLAFYRATGWKVLLPEMSFGWNYPPYAILMKQVVSP